MKGFLPLIYTFFTISLFLSLSSAVDIPHGASHLSRHRRIGRSLHLPAQTLLSQSVANASTSSAHASSPTSITFSANSSSFSSSVSSSHPSSASASITTSAVVQPIPTLSIDPTTASEISVITERRLSLIVGGLSPERAASISSWLSTLGANGKWPDSEVDYTTGCPARRANWPAQEHWQRLVVMAGAWHGGLAGTEQYVKNADLRAAITRGMDFWFSNDFTNPACIDSGGTASCPCDTPGLWNTNWFSNTILIPELSSETCLLLNDTLTSTQLSNCTHITLRAYGTFTRNPTFLTGANTLDVAKIGIDQGLLTSNVTLLTDAFHRVNNELVIQNKVKADGIRADGSFGQHAGILYNGNYGKDYTNDLLNLEVEAAGTSFAANTTSQNAFSTLFDGDIWMIFQNVITGVNHWDFSALGRFISFPVIDAQATGGLQMNLTEVQVLGEQWNSDALINFAKNLSRKAQNANVAQLIGNRMFYANDYMVHRGANYITTVKMYSKRTVNTECTNTQNPFGFHLSDGTIYTYLQGNEYEDISAAWDWNLIPGITVDYDATPLSCDHTGFTGIEAFVGGVSTGKIGAAAMRYTNPFTRSLQWQKAWFFLNDDVQHIMVSSINSSTDSSVFSVLDQRLHVGDVDINGVPHGQGTFSGSDVQSLWHGGVGYTLPSSDGAFELHVEVGEKTGDWSAIGTSTQPPPTVDLFAAYLEHQDLSTSLSYTAFPGVDKATFYRKGSTLRLQTIQNNNHVSAVYDPSHDVVMVVFWDANGGSVTFQPKNAASTTIASNGNAALVFKLDSADITISDPSQTLKQVTITITAGEGKKLASWGGASSTKTLVFVLPSGGLAGSSVTKNLNK